MKIGFDAKWFFDGPASGRRIVRGLVGGLSRTGGVHEIHYFLDSASRSHRAEIEVPDAQQHYVWAKNNQVSNVLAVPRLADQLGLDVVVYQNFVPPSMITRHARVAFVHDVIFHESPQYFTPIERLYFSTVRPLTRNAERACTVSLHEKQRMVRLGFSTAERIDVVPYGIDDVFKSAEPRSLNQISTLKDMGVHVPYVLYVGRLTRRKNVSTLIQAMAHLQSPLELVIVGAPDKTAGDLPALARELGVERKVRFLGPIYDDRLAALYAGAVAFCFPTWDESYGLPPLEAMAAGTPCVVSDIAVLREMYQDAAVFADPQDPRAFAAAIDQLHKNPDHVAEVRVKGRQRAASFTWDRAAGQLLCSALAAAAARN